MSKYTDAKRIANNKWDAANLDHLGLALPKGYRERVKARAADLGKSVNGYIRGLIESDLGIGCQDTHRPLGTVECANNGQN